MSLLNEQLGSNVTVVWIAPPKDKPATVKGVFHGAENGLFLIEINGKLTAVPMGGVRYILFDEA